MNKRQTEYIALYLFVFGAILLFGVLARKFVLVKGYKAKSALKTTNLHIINDLLNEWLYLLEY